MAETQHGIIPHLVVDDAAAAIVFYKQALGATENFRMAADDGKRVLHAELLVNGAKLFVRDDFPEYRKDHPEDRQQPPRTIGGTTATFHLDVANCDESFQRAVDAGASIRMAPMDAFWGARYAMVADPFGHCWSFAHPLPAKSA